ncbi:YybH family protein [Amycolatopsis sp. cmx-4-61]|uniref:YybH family protein n=1 Tax=Amycolatopsis sp. cmx-4-61 TaxID=2790937 RepID=UPI00397B3543
MPATEEREIATRVLDGWRAGIDDHRPADVAAHFTENALFQGAHPAYSLGRKGVEEYYEQQPVGLTVRYEIRELRPLADGVLLAYVDPDFTRPDGTVWRFHLTVLFERQDDGRWLIGHYHVSRI